MFQKGGERLSRAERHAQQYRAAYPPEDTQPRAPQSAHPSPQADEWDALYPDMVYQQRADMPQPPRGASAQPGTPVIRSAWAGGGAPRKPKHTALWAFIALICISLLALMGSFLASVYQEYAPFRQRVAVTQQQTFAQGVLVDDVHIGGMTRAQAEQALAQRSAGAAAQLNLTVRVDEQTWVITSNELPFERNIASVLDTAYAIGRQGSPETIGTKTSPFAYRYAHLHHTASNAAYLYTQVTYDQERVRSLVEIIRSSIERDAVDAQVATFDFNTRSFTFTEDQQGARLDSEALYQAIVGTLDRRDYTARIQAYAEPITPAVTKAELMNSFALVSSYTTDTTSSANRNNNIYLACEAVNGTVVMPGESFSFNQATGQRTTEKGYLPAAAIAGGTTVDEVGGGVCQVSSTLFNAAAMANMTILTRYPHTWPSNYVDKGRDATVNWPNLDFQFRNDSGSPVFIVAFYQNRKCTVELYGATPGAGQSIALATKIVSTTYPPQEALYQQNPLLPPGTVQELKKARTGYVVETYRVYQRNGAEYKRELLCTSTYKMIQQVIEYN